ncbi:MAG TPA: GNAT family N-acetyltransferase, partial [Acidimicrobiia bacterium]|nr:GNAT family N-acetyltransferase [Acidimicrobiia bacterium]
ALLDQRSDEFAVSVLAPLSTAQRDRLVAAMADVERLLTASMVDVAPIDPSHPHAAFCLRSYYAELDRRFTTGFDPDSSLAVLEDEIRPPAGVMLVATLHSEPVGCGCLKFHGRAPTEIKRLWVADAVRGLGIGRRLLRELEQRAAQSESRVVRLDTNAALVEAIAMYRSNGYSEIPAFNDEPYANNWFEKQL